MTQKKLSSGARIGLNILSVFLGIALFLCALSTCIVASGRVLTSADNLERIIQEFLNASNDQDTAAVPQKRYAVQPLSTASLSSDDMDFNMELDLTDALLDFIYEAVQAEMGVQLPVTREQLNELIERSTAKDYLAEKAAGLVSDFVRGESITSIEPEEIRQFIEENQELIEQVIGEPMSQEYKDQIVTWVAENETIEQLNKEGIVSLIPIPKEEPDSVQGMASSLYQMNAIIEVVRSVLSIPTLLAFIGVCLVLMGLIVLCSWGNWGAGLRRCGYPLVVAGLPMFACLSARFGGAPVDEAIVKVVWQAIASLSGVFAVTFVLGIALIIGGFVVAHLQRNALLSKAVPPVAEPVVAAPAVDEVKTEENAPTEDPSAEAESPVPALSNGEEQI